MKKLTGKVYVPVSSRPVLVMVSFCGLEDVTIYLLSLYMSGCFFMPFKTVQTTMYVQKQSIDAPLIVKLQTLFYAALFVAQLCFTAQCHMQYGSGLRIEM